MCISVCMCVRERNRDRGREGERKKFYNAANIYWHQYKIIKPYEFCFIGTILSLKGAVLTFACLDCMGTLIHPPYEAWKDPNATEDSERTNKRKLVLHSSCSQNTGDHQLAIICSEKQAKVFSLPSQICLYVHNITDTLFLQADVVTLCNSVCLACFCANGHIMILRYLIPFHECKT